MMIGRRGNLIIRLVKSKRVKSIIPVIGLLRSYHSYPNPDEKPQITKSKSTISKRINKNASPMLFNLDNKFGMIQPFPGAPNSQGINSSSTPPVATTKLNSGLTVASQDLPSLMTSIAINVRAGSAYEKQTGPDANTGTVNFIELNAFKSTHTKNQLEVITEIEKLGGIAQCVSTRENIMFFVDVLRENVEKAFEIFADSFLHPLYPEEELEETRAIVQFREEELPSDIISRDLVQRAAFLQSPLGHHQFCPVDKLSEINAKKLFDFRAQYFVAENTVVAAAGIEHNYLVSLTEKYFKNYPKLKQSQNNQHSNNNNSQSVEIIRPKSKYNPGLLTEQRTLKEPFVKLAMAFEVDGWKSQVLQNSALVTVCVMQQLLGGGSSFSAGGPGKGMYSRLYSQVLNRYYWAESIESFISVHDDHGIFGIDGACPPQNIAHLIKTIVEQLVDLAVRPISQVELSRAKNMLKSMMMMQLESRLVICEDLARQIATFGCREDPCDICKKIDAITEKDIMKVAEKMMQSPPAIGVVGHDLSHVPGYEEIKKFTQTYYQEAWRQNSIY